MSSVIIVGEEQISLARLLIMKSALSLEIKGLKRRGRSTYAIVKEELELKGNKSSVLCQLEKIVEERKIAIYGSTEEAEVYEKRAKAEKAGITNS